MDNSSSLLEIHRISKLWKSISPFLFDLLFPPECMDCGDEGTWLCAICRAKLDWYPPCCFRCGKLVPRRVRAMPGLTCTPCRRYTVVHAFFSPFRYEIDTIRSLIHAMKYRRLRALDSFFATILYEYIHTYSILFPSNLLIIPIPLHKARMRVRGFNQASCIAAQFAALSGWEYAPKCLIRTRATLPQVGLSYEMRKTNLAGAFAATLPQDLCLRPVLLVDDVKTTGSTIEEAARTLKKAGAGSIFVLTIAR
ncbi:MAG: phosphoribosyltransferase [Parcubacteria group bacterium Gr01-1014_66]|nr:MAG: phosphoribosyltransferase [Parcubacteria group bacterium Gr01-1014_66]